MEIENMQFIISISNELQDMTVASGQRWDLDTEL
jgi:hypothetical protein